MSVKRWTYDLLYRIGAPWDGPVRTELRELLRTGTISLDKHRTVLDLGCGSGTCSVHLAERGFDVTGVDFTPIALRKAEQAAAKAGVEGRCRFVRADLTERPLPGVEGTFDVLLDFGTLDDLTGEDRAAMAATIRDHTHAGSLVVLWCFYTDGEGLPHFRFDGVSKFHSALRPGEEQELFGDLFDIERLPDPPADSHTACFVLTRR